MGSRPKAAGLFFSGSLGLRASGVLPTLAEPSVILLTNDDGGDAPGLAALRVATGGLGECRVMAPLGPRSGCGHVVTTHAPIATSDHPLGQVSVDGTPADCVRLALHQIGRGID